MLLVYLVILQLVLSNELFVAGELESGKDDLTCYACTSLVQDECEYIYGFVSTYGVLETYLKKVCSQDENACATYTWTSDFGTGYTYLQRDCATSDNYCAEVDSLIKDIGTAEFDPKRNCRVCNKSLCNTVPYSEMVKSDRSSMNSRQALSFVTILFFIQARINWQN